MSGYFKVPMAAARAIVGVSEGPSLLAAYITSRKYAYGTKKDVTAAGARSIRLSTGCTDHRSKKLLRELLSFQEDHSSSSGLLELAGWKKLNATAYRLPPWEGEHAYLPALFLERHPEHGSPLLRVLSADEPGSVIRDALFLALHVYASVDYAEWFGCPPDTMVSMTWDQSGVAGDDFELGYQGHVGDLPLWLVAESQDATWQVPAKVVSQLFGPDPTTGQARFWAAWRCLLATRSVVPVISVQTRGRVYPLWIYSPAYRDYLSREHEIVPDLGRETQLAACSTGHDPDNRVIRYAVDEMNGTGSGLFYCVGKDPIVRTVIVPRLHAPTANNLDGLTEAAAVTRDISRTIRVARRADTASEVA